MAIYTGTAGADTFVGADGEGDEFRFTPATLGPLDIVEGGAGQTLDVLRFTAAGLFTDDMLVNVTGIERVVFAAAGSTELLLTAGMLATALGARIEVVGWVGDDRVVAPAGAAGAVTFRTGGGADSFIGGDGADVVEMDGLGSLVASLGAGDDTLIANPFDLFGAANVDAGTGTDTLAFSGEGFVTTGAFIGLLGFEVLRLSARGSTDLRLEAGSGLLAGGRLRIESGADRSAIVADSGITARLHVVTGSGADTIFTALGADTVEAASASEGALGAGRDLLRLLNTAAAAGAFDGGLGFDRIEIVGGGTHDLTRFTGFERIDLLSGATVHTMAEEGVEVVGSDERDRILLTAAGQTAFGEGGDDVITLTQAALDGAVVDGGAQTLRDTLVLQGAGRWDLRGGVVVSGFERILLDLSDVPPDPFAIPVEVWLGREAVELLLNGAAWVHAGSHAGQVVRGSDEDDSITLTTAGQSAFGGAGDDLIYVGMADLLAGSRVSGGSGRDRLVLTDSGTLDLRQVGVVQVEAVTLGQAAPPGARNELFTLARPMEVVGSRGADLITLRQGGSAFGREGHDTLRAEGGPAALDGGDGDDILILGSRAMAQLGAGRMTAHGGAGRDQLSISHDATSATVLTLRGADFTGIDRILIDSTASQQQSLRLVLTDGLAEGAQALGNGQPMLQVASQSLAGFSLTIDGSALGATRVLSVTDGGIGLRGADSILGGQGNDGMRGGAGNDTINGGQGNDHLVGDSGEDFLLGGQGDDLVIGGLGADRLRGGDGADYHEGGAGGDLIELAEALSAIDRVAYRSISDGTGNLLANGRTAQGQAQPGADRVTGFNTANDRLVLHREDLGLGDGGVVQVGVARPTGSVMVFHSEVRLSAAAGAVPFNEGYSVLNAISLGLLDPALNASGDAPAMLLIGQGNATGLYRWADTNANGLLGLGDDLRLMAVIDAPVTAFSASNIDLI